MKSDPMVSSLHKATSTAERENSNKGSHKVCLNLSAVDPAELSTCEAHVQTILADSIWNGQLSQNQRDNIHFKTEQVAEAHILTKSKASFPVIKHADYAPNAFDQGKRSPVHKGSNPLHNHHRQGCR
uniref:Uncharacterized protein n=1 Tax=Salix viminalis TaxID=40686 RepID=A0A6N2L7P1_SALVM